MRAYAGVLAMVFAAGCYSGVGGWDAAGGDAADGADGGADGGADDGDGPPPADFQPAPGAMRRLTTAQYKNSIADIFGAGIEPAADLEVDEETQMFLSIGAAKVGTGEAGVEQYRAAAFDVAGQVFERAGDYDVIASCSPAQATDPCVAQFVEHFGTRLWRRPMTAAEVDRYVALVGAESEEGQNLPLGMQYTLAALIESPNFIYVQQLGEEDPDSDLLRYTGYEMASRLSYFLWDSTPDDELLAAAAAGDLLKGSGLATTVRRMLDTPRAADLAARFFSENWYVYGLADVDKNSTTFPDWSASLLALYKEEFRLTLEDIVKNGGDIRQVLTGRTTFVNDELARVYGLPEPGPLFEPVMLDDTRYGLLTSGAVMAANAFSTRTSPTVRGVFLLERVLCEHVPPPPPGVNDELPPAEGETVRERLEQHRNNPVCAACHEVIDPLGFALENYDAVGFYRTEEFGTEIDASGEFEGNAFNGAGDLAQFLESDLRATECISKQLLAFATGRELLEQDLPAATELDVALADAGYDFRELVVALVTNPAFRYLEREEG